MSVPAGTVPPVTPKEEGSIDVVAEEVRWERDAQLRHFDALDGKAGILLGFAGVLVVLAGGDHPLVLIGRLVAASSGLTAMAAFWPRRYMSTEVRRLREKYLSSDRPFTRIRMLDTQIVMVESVKHVLLVKGRLLKVATGALAVAVGLDAVGLALD
jgi:hypothetical protein